MPLPPEVLAKIKDNIRESEKLLVDLNEDILEAHSAGIDVTEQRKQTQDLRSQIAKLKVVYGD